MFLELLALCQIMPGPTSTQMSFAIGITQQGVQGGLLSGKYQLVWSACTACMHVCIPSVSRNIKLKRNATGERVIVQPHEVDEIQN